MPQFYYTFYDENLLAFLTAENTTSIDVTLWMLTFLQREDFMKNHLLSLYVHSGKINTSNALG